MTAGPDVVVVGSLNVDLVVPVPHLPAPGETIAGEEHFKTLGGKGANQAVAAARLGRSVAMVGRVGTDAEGDECVSGLEREGVLARYVERDPEVPTGIAAIAVDPSGENSIVVGPGANARLTVQDVERASEVARDVAVTLVQLEIPMEAVRAATHLAGGRLVLNPAPAKSLPQDVLDRVDVLTPNEVELAMLSGARAEAEREIADAARSIRGPKAIAVTLGERGVLLVEGDEVTAVPSPKVTAADTTAAGDAFCGALADGLARGTSLVDAVGWGAAAAALSVTRRGAQPSLPTSKEVHRLIASAR